MILFNGKLTYHVWFSELQGSYPQFYFLMNFNDYASALFVLFQQMVVNNWWVVVDMTYDYCGRSYFVTHTYFISFYFVVCIILVNIMISIVLELYGSVTAEVE